MKYPAISKLFAAVGVRHTAFGEGDLGSPGLNRSIESRQNSGSSAETFRDRMDQSKADLQDFVDRNRPIPQRSIYDRDVNEKIAEFSRSRGYPLNASLLPWDMLQQLLREPTLDKESLERILGTRFPPAFVENSPPPPTATDLRNARIDKTLLGAEAAAVPVGGLIGLLLAGKRKQKRLKYGLVGAGTGLAAAGALEAYRRAR
jgi:hypothetical protein